VGTTGGADVVDDSQGAEHYYSHENVVNSNSTRKDTYTLFYLEVVNDVYDCLLLLDRCDSDVEVSNVSAGKDYPLCGTPTFPCKTINYAINNRFYKDKVIKIVYIENFNYTILPVNVNTTEKTLDLESTNDNKPFLRTCQESCVNTPLFDFTWGVNSGVPNLVLKNLFIYFDVTNGGGPTGSISFLDLGYNGNLGRVELDGVEIKATSATPFSNSLFHFRPRCSTSLVLNDCAVSGFNFVPSAVTGGGYNVIYYGDVDTSTNTAVLAEIVLRNCSFFDMNTTSHQSIILCYNSTSAHSHYIEIDRTKFYNLRCLSPSVVQGGNHGMIITVYTEAGSVIEVVNSEFKNIIGSKSQNGGCIYFGGVEITNFLFQNCVFENISGVNYGGAIFSDISIPPDVGDGYSEGIINSVFRNCSARMGGAIYVMDGPFHYVNVTFDINFDDGNHGNDIYDAVSDHSSYYNNENVRMCCSSSNTPKFTVNSQPPKDFDELLQLLCDLTYLYVSQNGDDSNACSISSYCKTLRPLLTRFSPSVYSIVIDYLVAYGADPINIGSKSVHLMSDTTNIDSYVKVTYETENGENSLLTVGSGILEVTNIHFCYNGRSKGSFISVTSNGIISVGSVRISNGGVNEDALYSFAVFGSGSRVNFLEVSKFCICVLSVVIFLFFLFFFFFFLYFLG
jgi:hypothetical protein